MGIAAYRAKSGKLEALKTLMISHMAILLREGLVTHRKSIVMEAEDHTIIEVFEWKSKQAIEDAHNNSAVQEMWGKYSEVCEFIPAGQVTELSDMFSEFSAVN